MLRDETKGNFTAFACFLSYDILYYNFVTLGYARKTKADICDSGMSGLTILAPLPRDRPPVYHTNIPYCHTTLQDFCLLVTVTDLAYVAFRNFCFGSALWARQGKLNLDYISINRIKSQILPTLQTFCEMLAQVIIG